MTDEETNPTPKRKHGETTQKASRTNSRSKGRKIRRSEEIKKQDPKFIPRTYKEVMGTLYWHEWKKAMENETNSLRNEHKVWKLVERQEEKKIIMTKWVYTIKENPDGSIKRRKARLVAVGNNQREGIYLPIYLFIYLRKYSLTSKKEQLI